MVPESGASAGRGDVWPGQSANKPSVARSPTAAIRPIMKWRGISWRGGSAAADRAEIARLRDAERLVRTQWAQECIRLVADALLRHGTLTGDEIGVKVAAHA
jgi:hypothetical protein